LIARVAEIAVHVVMVRVVSTFASGPGR
jgi:hypothetical protein